jgi:branched-chain amino acid transport system permease protein
VRVFSVELLLNAVAAGLLLGGFYAAVSLGISVTFGLLDIANIAHPVFVIAGAYAAYILNTTFGLDPILVGLLCAPLFYGLGVAVYRVYYISFEKKGDQSLRGLVFFFGLMFIIEVALILVYGVDYRMIEAPYIGSSIFLGPLGLSLRLLIPCAVGVALTVLLYVFLAATFYGRAIRGVSQDSLALRLMGADPIKMKTMAFGVGIAMAGLAGALLIIIGPVEPAIGREYIGRVFAIAVLGGMGSIGGTLLAALILGVAESLTSTFSGPSWALAVSFGLLLFVLAVRPAGLFGR